MKRNVAGVELVEEGTWAWRGIMIIGKGSCTCAVKLLNAAPRAL